MVSSYEREISQVSARFSNLDWAKERLSVCVPEAWTDRQKCTLE